MGQDTKHSLLKILADGEFHSGEALGVKLGVSRAAIWKQLSALESLGLIVESRKGVGYRVADGMELLDERLIRSCLGTVAAQKINRVELHDQLASTNRRAMAVALQGPAAGLVCLAEMQSQGKGRLGRDWVSPYGRNLYLSLVWQFDAGVAALEGLSLAVSVALSRTLHAQGIHGFGVKWPNDLLADGKKFSGVLIELAGDLDGPCQAVIGIGVNIALPDRAGSAIGQPWTDLSRIARQVIARNQLAGKLINELILVLLEFEQHGFAAFRKEWEAIDLLLGEQVIVKLGTKRLEGIARGVALSGALRVEMESGLTEFSGGEVSVRARQ